MVLTTSDLCRGWMASIQELLDYLVNVQDPSHQTVHLLVQGLKPTRGIDGYSRTVSWLNVALQALSSSLFSYDLTNRPHQAVLPFCATAIKPATFSPCSPLLLPPPHLCATTSTSSSLSGISILSSHCSFSSIHSSQALTSLNMR